MAVQTLAKDQATKEKKKQKELDDKFKKDDENAEKDAGRYMDLMDRIYNKSKDLKAPESIAPDSRLMRKIKSEREIIGAKKGEHFDRDWETGAMLSGAFKSFD